MRENDDIVKDVIDKMLRMTDIDENGELKISNPGSFYSRVSGGYYQTSEYFHTCVGIAWRCFDYPPSVPWDISAETFFDYLYVMDMSEDLDDPIKRATWEKQSENEEWYWEMLHQIRKCVSENYSDGVDYDDDM